MYELISSAINKRFRNSSRSLFFRAFTVLEMAALLVPLLAIELSGAGPRKNRVCI